jgi:diguanylate cyclase (GGDEF)-like protein
VTSEWAPNEAETLSRLLAGLETAPSGVDYIYDLLRLLAARHHLADVSVVVEDEARGQHVFSLGSLSSIDPGRDDTTTGIEVPPADSPPRIITVPADGLATSLKQAAERLCSIALALETARHDAAHDPLTALANRHAFDSALDKATAQSERYGWQFSLVILDLDHLKAVNDTRGHQAGDELLRSFGDCLRRSVRVGDTAARIGGDEFAVILGNTGRIEVDAFLTRLRRHVQSEAPDAEFAAGAASSPDDATRPDDLFRLADLRLYEAKDA